jgi:hypothetical protein
MNTNLNKVALDLYKILDPRFSNVKMGDENAAVLSAKTDIPNARFFEFEYKHDGVPLGTIAITLDEDEGMLVELVGNLAKNNHRTVFKFIRSLRQFAKDRLIDFKVDKIGKESLDKRDYAFKAKPKEMPEMEPIIESKLYGTSKISYQDLGEARLVIRHSQPVNLDLAAGRTMHIDSIYVENSQGERFRYPYKHLNGARALAEHIKAGGNPYDPIGKHITSLSEELAQLRKFKGYVSRNEALSEAMGDITSKVMERIEEVKKEVSMLQRTAYYQQFAESFENSEEQMIPEEIMSDWIDRLTIRTFNEDLKTAFPYIFKLVDESEIPVKELSPDDLLAEKSTSEKQARFMAAAAHDPKFAKKVGMKQSVAKEFNKADTGTKQLSNAMKHKKNRKTEESYLEEFMNAIVEDSEDQEGRNTLFSKNIAVRQHALKKLKGILAPGLPAGQSGLTASQSLKGIIDSDIFTKEYLSRLNGNDDAAIAVKMYIGDLADDEIHEPLAPRAGEISKEIVAGNELNFNHSNEEPVGGEPMPGADAGAPPEAGAPPAPPPEAPPAPPPEAGAPPAPPPEAGAPPAGPEAGAPPAPPVAENIARLKAKLIKVFEAGASLDTKLDFGYKVMTLGEAMDECGCDMQVAPEPQNQGNPVEEILKSVSGFWNPQKRNFTIGGTRAKIKVLKDFKNGEFKGATPQDVKRVIALIDRMDPGSAAHSNELAHIKKLAGVIQQ